MKSYKDIFRDFCNTTRLKFRSFMCYVEDKKREEEEYLKSFTQSFIDRLFK